MLRRQIRLGHDTHRLREERQRAAVSLRHARQIERRADPLYDSQRRETGVVGAVEIEAHGVARAAGELRDGHLVQRACSVCALAQPVPHFVRDAVARAARDDIVRFNVEALCNLYAMPVVCRLLDVEVAPRGRQDGRNLLVVGF